MPLITLLTDFGVDDEYVGVMKGVILSINPSAIIVDITHSLEPQDIVQASYLIKSSYRFFPEKTIHIIVIDPGVGTGRSIIALKMMGQIFLAPDNGVLAPLMDDGDMETMVSVENQDFFLKPVSNTFHGRDIFAPVAAYLSNGVGIRRFGPSMEKAGIVQLSIRKPYISDKGALVGSVISIDRFGNLITNIDIKTIKKFVGPRVDKKIKIHIGNKLIVPLSESYEKACPQTPLAIIGSRGYLEIAVNCGNAKKYFTSEKGDTIKVIIDDFAPVYQAYRST